METNHGIIMDPSKSLSGSEADLAKNTIERILRSAKRHLHLPSSKSVLTVAKRDAYIKFSVEEDTAHGVAAIAERYMTGSAPALKRDDFDMVCEGDSRYAIAAL